MLIKRIQGVRPNGGCQTHCGRKNFGKKFSLICCREGSGSCALSMSYFLTLFSIQPVETRLFVFDLYYLHQNQWCSTVLFCTLLTCVVKRGLFNFMTMSCTSLWQIHPVGFQLLRGFRKYGWTYINKTFWVELSFAYSLLRLNRCNMLF